MSIIHLGIVYFNNSVLNVAQFLNITPLFLSSPCLAANNYAAVLGASRFGPGPVSPAIVIVPLTRIYASL